MATSSIDRKVREIVALQLGLVDEDVSIDSSFVDDLGADSLDVIELIMALEEEFDVEIPDEDAERFSTIEDVVNYLSDKTR
jgi:acyl carrier protein